MKKIKHCYLSLRRCFHTLWRHRVDYMGSEGEGNATSKPVSEYTVWTTLSDLTHCDMMVRGYNDINYKTWSLSQFKNATAPVFEKINVKG